MLKKKTVLMLTKSACQRQVQIVPDYKVVLKIWKEMALDIHVSKVAYRRVVSLDQQRILMCYRLILVSNSSWKKK